MQACAWLVTLKQSLEGLGGEIGDEMEKNQYDEKLNSIIKQYGYEAKGVISSTQVHAAVVDIFTERCVNKKVAIWGVGKKNTVNSHAAVIINKYILNLQGLEFLVDSSADIQGTEFMGYPVIAPEDLVKTDVDIVIIGSRASAEAIIKNAKEMVPGCECLNIYEELRKRGIVIDYNFFSEQNMYTRLYQLRADYEKAEEGRKAALLKEIIAGYLEIRDFFYAEKYAGLYIQNKYENCGKLAAMMEQIREVQDEIIRKNSVKKGNVLVHLIDSLRAVDVFGQTGGELKYKMFSGYQKNAVSFTNAYSTGPTTYESMMGVVKRKLSFEEDVYDNNFMFSFEEFPILRKMKGMGKKIIFYVAKDYYIMEGSGGLERKEHLHMSEKLWNAACDMAGSGQEIFGFLYYPWELHFPLLCGFLSTPPTVRHFSDVGVEDMSGFIENQFEDCKRYVDVQFSYYQDMLGKHTTNVFMGDHSQPVYSKEYPEYPYYMYYNDPDRASHVAFFVSGQEYEKRNHSGLVSMLDFNQIMEEVVCNKNMEFPVREVVQYQYYNIQNKKLREVAEKNGFWDYTEGIQCFLSDRHLFAITATGKEEVYKKTDRGFEYDDGPEGAEFAEKIKRGYDTGFPDFWTIRYGRI